MQGKASILIAWNFVQTKASKGPKWFNTNWIVALENRIVYLIR